MKVTALVAATAILLAGCASPGSGVPNPIPGRYQLYGAGAYGCDTWTTSRGNTLQPEFDNWLMGFVSGYGHGIQEWSPLYQSNYADMSAWVDHYCRDYPGTLLADAAAQMIKTMTMR